MRPSLYDLNTFTPEGVDRAKLHEMAIDFAVTRFALKGEVPFLWLIARYSQVAWIETPWDSEQEKYRHVAMIADILRHSNAHAYAQISEAWVTRVTVEEEAAAKAAGKRIVPRDMPANRRDDVLFVNSCDRSGDFGFTRFLVTARPGKLNLLGPRVDENWDTLDGTMTNLFAREAT
jgi:hypothetical protein